MKFASTALRAGLLFASALLLAITAPALTPHAKPAPATAPHSIAKAVADAPVPATARLISAQAVFGQPELVFLETTTPTLAQLPIACQAYDNRPRFRPLQRGRGAVEKPWRQVARSTVKRWKSGQRPADFCRCSGLV